MGTQDPTWHFRLHDVPGPRGRSAGVGLPGRIHHPQVPPAGHRRPARLAASSRATGCSLGAADEKKPAAAGTVEAWGRSADNPVGGWYGLRNGYRGRFGMYLPPLLEALGLAEVTHDPRNNRMRAT